MPKWDGLAQVDYDWAGANASFQRAVALEPANAENVGFAAWSATILGRFGRGFAIEPPSH